MFLPTEHCEKYPSPMRYARPELPVAHLSNEEIDQALSYIVAKGATYNDIPTSQYGRRVAVSTYCDLERGIPVDRGQDIPRHYREGQPR